MKRCADHFGKDVSDISGNLAHIIGNPQQKLRDLIFFHKNNNYI